MSAQDKVMNDVRNKIRMYFVYDCLGRLSGRISEDPNLEPRPCSDLLFVVNNDDDLFEGLIDEFKVVANDDLIDGIIMRDDFSIEELFFNGSPDLFAEVVHDNRTRFMTSTNLFICKMRSECPSYCWEV